MPASSGYLYSFRPDFVNRDAFIVSRCIGKTVCHIGCTDFPITLHRINSGLLLHCKLEKITKSLLGIDVDAAGIELLKAKCERNLFMVQDMTVETAISIPPIWEIVLLLDVIEHVTKVHNLISNSKKLMQSNGEMVITVPNALSARALLRAAFNKERVHTDHVAYYSPATLYQLGKRYDLKPLSIFTFNYAYTNKLLKLFIGHFTKHFPLCADGIGVIFKSF